jgi:hypothetical protein
MVPGPSPDATEAVELDPGSLKLVAKISSADHQSLFYTGWQTAKYDTRQFLENGLLLLLAKNC